MQQENNVTWKELTAFQKGTILTVLLLTSVFGLGFVIATSSRNAQLSLQQANQTAMEQKELRSEMQEYLSEQNAAIHKNAEAIVRIQSDVSYTRSTVDDIKELLKGR